MTHNEFHADFLRFNGRKKHLAKKVDLVSLEELVGPGALDPDLGHSH